MNYRSISSIRMNKESRASTSSAENENSLDELFINAVSEENNEIEFTPPCMSPNLSCRSTPTLERKSEFVYLLFSICNYKRHEIYQYIFYRKKKFGKF